MPSHQTRHRPDPNKSLVGFFVGEVHYAIEIASVREIVNPLPVTPLPHMPVEVAGVADHRGNVVPVIDLRARFGLPAGDGGRATKWIFVTARSRPFGIVVDRVTEVFGAGNDQVKPPPPVGGRVDLRAIRGVLPHREGLAFLLDLDRFIDIVEGVDFDRQGLSAAPERSESLPARGGSAHSQLDASSSPFGTSRSAATGSRAAGGGDAT